MKDNFYPLKCFFPVLHAVKPTVIHTDMFVNSIGPVNAINMVSEYIFIVNYCEAGRECFSMRKSLVSL